MPIPFASIHEHLRLSVVQKQGIADFVNFHESSRNSFAICKKVKTKFTFETEHQWGIFKAQGEFHFLSGHNTHKQIYARNMLNTPVVLEGRALCSTNTHFASEECEWLTNLFSVTGATFEILDLTCIECSPEELNALLYAADVVQLWTSGDISQGFLETPAMKQLDTLRCYNSDINNEDLLALNLNYAYIYERHNITTSGINSFLKKWQKGEQGFFHFNIAMDAGTSMDEILNGVSYTILENKSTTKFKLMRADKQYLIVFYDDQEKLVDIMRCFDNGIEGRRAVKSKN